MQVGAYEAKTRFSELLSLTEKGEKVIVTRHNQPVAVLVPFASVLAESRKEVLARIKKRRRQLNPPGAEPLTYKDLINEGRRF